MGIVFLLSVNSRREEQHVVEPTLAMSHTLLTEMKNTIVFLILSAIFAYSTHAAEIGLPLPRFASLKANETNLRSGPAHHYPIQFVYKFRHYPMEILAEFGHWRLISDKDGSQGWVHQSLLSGVRYVVIKNNELFSKKLTYKAPQLQALMFRLPDDSSYPLARIEVGSVAKVKKCIAQWCQIEADGKRGWLRKSNLWGVYTDELLEK